MGDKLLRLFEFVGEQGGLPAQMRLAILTGMTARQAVEKEDTPANMEALANAVREVTHREPPSD